MNETDIRLSSDWQLTQAADGDAPLCTGADTVYQCIALEAVTQTGDLFYDLEFGWGLYEFIQSENSDLLQLELITRARNRLCRYGEINPNSIMVTAAFRDDTFYLSCLFQFYDEEISRRLNVTIGAVAVEVNLF